MGEKGQKRNLLLCDMVPIILMALLVPFAVYLGNSGARLFFDCLMLFLLLAGMSAGYLVGERIGWALLAALTACYILHTAITGTAHFLHWVCVPAWSALFYYNLLTLKRGIVALELEKTEKEAQLDRVSLVDHEFGIRNLRAFQNDAANYPSIASRYQLHLWLVLWRWENAPAFKAALDEESFRELVQDIGGKLRLQMRLEDMVFLVDGSLTNMTWGTLHIANQDAHELIIERVSSAIASIPLDEKLGMKLDFSTSISSMGSEERLSPAELLNRIREDQAGMPRSS